MEFRGVVAFFDNAPNRCKKNGVQNAICDHLSYKTVFLLYETFNEPSVSIVLLYYLLQNLNTLKYCTLIIKSRLSRVFPSSIHSKVSNNNVISCKQAFKLVIFSKEA